MGVVDPLKLLKIGWPWVEINECFNLLYESYFPAASSLLIIFSRYLLYWLNFPCFLFINYLLHGQLISNIQLFVCLNNCTGKICLMSWIETIATNTQSTITIYYLMPWIGTIATNTQYQKSTSEAHQQRNQIKFVQLRRKKNADVQIYLQFEMIWIEMK